jgi:hypothetical protein
MTGQERRERVTAGCWPLRHAAGPATSRGLTGGKERGEERGEERKCARAMASASAPSET